MNTEFHFKSQIFRSDSMDIESNLGLPEGREVAVWLRDRLRAVCAVSATEPEQEDFGWYITFELGGVGHCIVIYSKPGDSTHSGMWVGWVERQRGLFSSVLGFRGSGILPEALKAVELALNSPEILQLTWHKHS
jgi:hypothetical protein